MKYLIVLLGAVVAMVPLYSQKGDVYRVNKVVIDAGHGGHDPGTQGKLYKEKDIALDIAIELGKYIRDNNPNVEVVFTRTGDQFVPLFKRIGLANKENADLFVSIHCNSSKKKEVKGSETYVMGLHRAEENLEVAERENEVILLENDFEENYEGYDPRSPVGHIVLSSFQDAYLSQSLSVAAEIEKELKAQGYTTSRGVKQAGFAVLRRATMPSILIETGFLSNSQEEKYLGSKKGKQEVSHSIYRALSNYLNPVIGSSKYQKVSSPITNSRKFTGRYFNVQFVALKNKLDDQKLTKLKQIGEVKIINEKNLYKYQITLIPNLEKAKEVKKQLANLGYKGSFIIASE